jgi:hypothetical protein
VVQLYVMPMMQVLINLGSNSVKYATKMTLTVSLCSNRMLRFEVHDNGRGLSEEFVSQWGVQFSQVQKQKQNKGIARLLTEAGAKLGQEQSSGVWAGSVDVRGAGAADGRGDALRVSGGGAVRGAGAAAARGRRAVVVAQRVAVEVLPQERQNEDSV